MRKIIIIVLSFLFVLSLLAGVIGFINKDKLTNEVIDNTTDNLSFTTIKLSEEELKIEKLNEIFGNYEFVKANESVKKESIEVNIENEQVKGIFNEMSFNIDESIHASSVQCSVANDHAIIYILDTSNNVYKIEVTIEETNIVNEIFKFDLDNIDAFIISSKKLTDEFYDYPYIILKSGDSYYSDYKKTETDNEFRKLSNLELTNNE